LYSKLFLKIIFHIVLFSTDDYEAKQKLPEAVTSKHLTETEAFEISLPTPKAIEKPGRSVGSTQA
jgi:hypothetical protein